MQIEGQDLEIIKEALDTHIKIARGDFKNIAYNRVWNKPIIEFKHIVDILEQIETHISDQLYNKNLPRTDETLSSNIQRAIKLQSEINISLTSSPETPALIT